jgi:hypothetical protein
LSSNSLRIYDIDIRPFGRTYSKWIEQWWHWLLSIPKSDNPANDHTGSNAYRDQHDRNVFFLCQTIESADSVPDREITVKYGQVVFMPVINWISAMGIHGKDQRELLAVAKAKMDVVVDLELVIDGTKARDTLREHRAHSGLFSVDLPNDNVLGLKKGSWEFISDGYWIFFYPKKGRTRLYSRASCSQGLTNISVNYDIITTS